jgi:2-polyprenyl-6-methoxyphenol hydroxylase-like FAD-dependent oxidoreductase
MTAGSLQVLVVGAGPTGLALAAQLRRFGTRFRIIDRSLDGAHESRALAVQARTLEILDSIGLADQLVSRGNRSAKLAIHLGARRVAATNLGEFGAEGTRYPFILFVSQAETERVLGEHLAASGVALERGVELVRVESLDEMVECVLRYSDGREEHVRTEYLVGCDGAHSTVREGAGFAFRGGSYPEDFLLGDIEADGPLERDTVHSFAGDGVAMFFPLGAPRTWRVVAMEPRTGSAPSERADGRPSPTVPLTLEELQRAVAAPTAGSVSIRDPAWLSRFRLHHRQTGQYRRGHVFLAGDAAHVHSPVGAQGMNTGIQDAWNLGWKLGLVAGGAAPGRLLESYEAERWPVGRTLLRYTDRVFSVFTRAMSSGRAASWAREVVAPLVLPRVLASTWLRSKAFRFVSELAIAYPQSPVVLEGEPRLRRGPRAGQRLPDAQVAINGRSVSLQKAVVGARHSLLLCGDPRAWDLRPVQEVVERRSDVVAVQYLSDHEYPGALVCKPELPRLLGVDGAAQYLIRPDGYIASRCGGRNLDGLSRYLAQWVVRLATASAELRYESHSRPS